MDYSAGASANDYSRADRILHRIALGFRPLLDFSFDLERMRYGKAADALDSQAPVFVCGLARAGTTIAMRLLHATGAFASLSYRDLPLPLAPNSWAALSPGRHVQARERGHGDGLMHDLDSPEAIEEVFWRTHEGERYLRADGLVPVPPEPATLRAFAGYVRLVQLRYGRPRYLSKNNNNLLRLPALCEAFADACLLHPFRDPLQQALSLRDQHRRACELAVADPFRGQFMQWLGHHEFGAFQRPFLLEGAPPADGDRDGLDYWLAQWIAVHRLLLSQPAEVAARQCFLDYDLLPDHRPAFALKLQRYLQLDALPSLDGFVPVPARPVGKVDPALEAQARELHGRLRQRFLQAGR